jgi:DNA-binding PadR family transcriptional regulator
MNKQKRKILDLLSDGTWWFGAELVRKSDGVLGRGTVYVWLSELEEQGLVKRRVEGRAHAFRITKDGAAFEAE